MTLSSIVPSEMTQREIKHVCIELYTAKRWGLDHSVVKLSNGLEYKLPVTRWAEYNKHFKSLSTLDERNN
jgi:hypothetical protein